jgi:WD40 repeat protein
LIPLILWFASSSANTPVAPPPDPNPTATAAQKSTTMPAPPPATAENREAKLTDLLKQKPAAGAEAHFFALLLTVAGDTVTVAPRVGEPKVAVVFPGLIEESLKRQAYQPDDLVEVIGTVMTSDDPAVGLRIAGQVIQKADYPATRVLAKDLPVAASPSPPQVAKVPTPAPAEPPQPKPSPTPPPAAVPMPTPSAPKPAPAMPASPVMSPVASISPGGLQRPINAVAWSPNSAKLLVASQPAVIVDAATGQELLRLGADECQQAEWSSNGQHVALHFDRLNNVPGPGAGAPFGVGAMGARGGLIVWEVSSGKEKLSLPSSDQGEALFSFNPKSQVLAVVHDVATQNVFITSGKRVTQVNFAAGKLVPQAVENFLGTARLAWKHDGSQLAWAIRGTTNSIRIMRAGSRGGPTSVPLNGEVNDLAWVPKSNLLAVSGPDGLQVGDMSNVQKFRLVLSLTGVRSLKKCSFSGDGRLAAVEVNQDIQVWRLDDSNAPQWSQSTTDRWRALAWSPTVPVLAAMDTAGTIAVWNEKGERLATLKSNLTALSYAGLVWSPSGQRLAAFGQNANLVLFDTSSF